MQAHDTNRTKFDSRDYRCECAECGQHFEATRSDASFCSTKCRVAFSRRPAKLRHAIEAVDAFCKQVNDYSTRYGRNDDMFKAMLKLQTAVGAAISRFEN